MAAMSQADRAEERQRLINLVNEWNKEHYDIFELSQPNEDLDFHGVVKFYFQDSGQNFASKCIRVASSATSKEVVQVLVEKFRADMRMLTVNKYCLYEAHGKEDARRLLDDERPLLVQLNWGKDVREGRFLLRREGEPMPTEKEIPPGFKRKLSKRQKKEEKKKEKEKLRNKENIEKDSGVAEKLYNEVPETPFSRTISNPEMVMRRRRQQILEKKLQQFRGQDGQGGTLKIYGESLSPDKQYVTLLLSTADTVSHVVREAMEKYGLSREDPLEFCLVQLIVPPGEREFHGGPMGEERVLEEDECPLAIAMQHPPNRGMLMFQLNRHNPEARKPKHKKLRSVSHEDLRSSAQQQQFAPSPSKLPFLVELNPDGSENPKAKVHRLHLDVTEVGCERSMASTGGQYLQLFGPNIEPRHCVLAHTDGIVTVTPTSRNSETYVNNQRIDETTLLVSGMTVRFGQLHLYRFIDPHAEESQRQRKGKSQPDGSLQRNTQPFNGRPQETNFDVDGRIETVGNSPRQEERPLSQADTTKRSPPDSGFGPGPEAGKPEPERHLEEALPAALEFREDREDAFLSTVILDANVSAIQFKLSPTYILYMAVRYRLSSAYRPDMSPSERAHRLTSLVNKIANMIHQTIQENRDNPASLAFWMANASEILHFFKQDHDVHLFSQDAQELLAEAVQLAFHHLVQCLQYDLQRTMPAFLDENDDEDDIDDGNRSRPNMNRARPNLTDVLDTLSSAMNLLRRCRVNAALTIQLFSQLFHFVNMWLFNILVTEPRHRQLCTKLWGMRLKRRLGRVEAWAEKQGLELAADCHLCRIIQAAHLLQAPKSSPDDIANISSTCFKLNSMQLRGLLERYLPADNEPPIPQNLVDRVVAIAENMADELIRTDGRDICLEEDPDLQLPFLLPEDGYSCDTIRSIPNGLGEFIDPLTRAGFCRMTPQPAARGLWTVYMTDEEGPRLNETPRKSDSTGRGPSPEPHMQPTLRKEPEVINVTFNKVKGSMGLSIVAAKGEGQKERGIYVKSVVPNGAAALDGRLQAGDQLLEVDGKSLVGLTQEKAAGFMTRTGHTVTLKVAKQGAFYHGLAMLLSQPSPTMPRASPQKGPGASPAPVRHPNDEGPPPYNGTPDDRSRQRDNIPQHHKSPAFDKQRQLLQSPHSRSSPALNTSDGQGGDRFRAISSGNLNDTSIPYQQPSPKEQPYRRDNRELDNKSKSIPNLRMDSPPDKPDHAVMRPAASVSAIQHTGQGPNYYNQGEKRGDPRDLNAKMHDYENQPQVERFDKNVPDSMRNDRGYPDINQNLPPGGQYAKPHMQHPLERAPASTRTSTSSGRDERPRSAYYPPHDRPDYAQSQGRPKSDELNPERMRDLHDQFRMEEKRGQQSPHDRSFENRTPNYSNIRPGSQPAPGYANQAELRPQGGHMHAGDFPKMNSMNHLRQPNFYENTSPRQQEPAPPFQQLRRPPSESDKSRPSVAPKPAVAAKPTQPRVNPAEIPRVDVDNRQTQSHFFDPKLQDQRSSYPPASQGGYNAAPQPQYQNINYGDPRNGGAPRQKLMSPGREMYDPHQSPELPPPPVEIPPELPPPPGAEDFQDEELPPLPPPPTQDQRLEQQLREEQNRMMQQMDPRYGSPQVDHRYGGQQVIDAYNHQPAHPQMQQQGYPDQRQMAGYPGDRNHEPQIMAGYAEQNRQGPTLQAPAGQLPPHHDYQNISYQQDNRTPDRSFETQPPGMLPGTNNLYESYDPRLQPQRLPQIQQPDSKRGSRPGRDVNRYAAVPPSQPISQIVVKELKEQQDSGSNVSPWDREEREKAQKRQEQELNRLRDQEIEELESKSYLTPQEQDRLRKLRLEQEFQRRVAEVSSRDDEDEDSDTDITERALGRERLMQVMQDDLAKTKARLQDLDQKQMFEEYELEKERLQRLERKLEIFETEREEQRKRLQKRQEKQQKQHEEYLQKQKDIRDKQRRDYENQKRMFQMEDEKMQQRKQEELRKKKEMEREQLRQMQAQRDAEEAALREEARQREEEFRQQQLAQQQQERREQEREIRVNEERKRLEKMTVQATTNPQYGYQPYANIPAQPPAAVESRFVTNLPQVDRSTTHAPPPPQRGSSYDVANQAPQYRPNSSSRIPEVQNQNDSFVGNTGYRVADAQSVRNMQDFGTQKKSVSFNTQLETRINRYSVGEDSSHPSYSSYRSSSQGSQSSEPTGSQSSYHPAYGQPETPVSANLNPQFTPEVFETPPQNHVPDVKYRVTETPGVVGAQEVYRDPKTRIDAKRAAQRKNQGPERLSFRDKMKFFATEAGENTLHDRKKASRTQRAIESQLTNGQ